MKCPPRAWRVRPMNAPRRRAPRMTRRARRGEQVRRASPQASYMNPVAACDAGKHAPRTTSRGMCASRLMYGANTPNPGMSQGQCRWVASFSAVTAAGIGTRPRRASAALRGGSHDRRPLRPARQAAPARIARQARQTRRHSKNRSQTARSGATENLPGRNRRKVSPAGERETAHGQDTSGGSLATSPCHRRRAGRGDGQRPPRGPDRKNGQHQQTGRDLHGRAGLADIPDCLGGEYRMVHRDEVGADAEFVPEDAFRNRHQEQEEQVDGEQRLAQALAPAARSNS